MAVAENRTQERGVADAAVGDVGERLHHGVALRRRRGTRLLRRYRSVLLSVGLIIVVLAAWQASADLNWVDPTFTSSPWAIAVAAYHFIPSSEGLKDMRVSGEELAIGFLMAIGAGVVFGLLMGWYRYIEEATGLALNIFYSIPIIALAPVLIVWFGIGMASKVAVVFIAALFPITINTLTGVKNVDRTLLDVARSFNAKNLQIWGTVVLPASVPSIMTGLRLGMVGALVGVVVGEFIAATAGIGYLVTVAANNFNTTLVFVGILIIAVAAVILTTILKAIERHFSSWRVE